MSAPLADHPAELLPWYVNGTLENEERERVEEHLGSCLSCRREVAELESLRREVKEEPAGEPPGQAGLDRLMREVSPTSPASSSPASRRYWHQPWLRAAAMVILVAGVFLWQPWNTPPPAEYRQGPEAAIRSLVAADEALPREGLVLRWTVDPELAEARFDVYLSTGALEPIHHARGLDARELRVPASALAALAPGAKLYWQVEAVLPEGERLLSPTFQTRLE